MLATILVVGPFAPATAGVVGVGTSIADFTFVDGVPAYDTERIIVAPPEPDRPDLRSIFASVGPDLVSDTERARLRLDKDGRELLGNDDTVLAVMQPIQEQSTSQRLRTTLDAMPPSTLGSRLSFLMMEQPVSGEVALRYRNIGIFTRVAGLDDAEWARDFDSSASLLNLSSDAAEALRAALPERLPAVPIPAPLLLIPLGLLWLLRLRRR